MPRITKRARTAVTRNHNWKPTFLKSLADTGIVSKACESAKIERVTAYTHRKKFPSFRRDWKAAIAKSCDDLEDVARKRAKDGSDTLLMFLLKGARPRKYRDNVKIEQTGKMVHDHRHEVHAAMDGLLSNPEAFADAEAFANRLKSTIATPSDN